jgi:hypothetical protein
MADPRLAVAYEGIGAVIATFKIDNSTIVYSATQNGGSAAVGLAVTESAADTIKLTEDGEGVLGKLLAVESDNIATVQIGGAMKLPGGNGASLTRMKKIVGALGAGNARGYIREVNTAQAAELGVARGMILDATDATAVELYL